MTDCIYFRIPSEIRSAVRSQRGLLLRGIVELAKERAHLRSAQSLLTIFDGLSHVRFRNISRFGCSTPGYTYEPATPRFLPEELMESTKHLRRSPLRLLIHTGNTCKTGFPYHLRLLTTNILSCPAYRIKSPFLTLAPHNGVLAVVNAGQTPLPISNYPSAIPLRMSTLPFSSAEVITEDSPLLVDDYSISAMKGNDVDADLFAHQVTQAFTLLRTAFPELADKVGEDS